MLKIKFFCAIRKPKPFAFIEFLHYEEARDAKEGLDRRDFHGRQIDVVFAQERRKTPDQMRHRDGPILVHLRKNEPSNSIFFSLKETVSRL